MSATELDQFLKTHPEIRYLDAFYPDLSCVFRGKRYPINQAHKVYHSGAMSPGGTF